MRLSVLVTALCIVFPVEAQKWRQYVDVEKAGWSASELGAAREFATSIGSAAVFVIDRGKVVAAWGDIDHPFKTASIRKSLYDAAIGASHLHKPFDVDTQLAKLGIDDIQKLSDRERRATFEQLLMARSGVFHTAAYETRSNAARRPARNSAAPGTLWYYNNWDFNVLCVAFEKLAGTTIQQAFLDRLAKPLGMEDFESSHVFECVEPRMSRHPAITYRLSARDLARVGLLYLRGGKWQDDQIVAADWVKRSTMPHTTFEEGHYRGAGNGYGRLWWVFPARPERNSPYQAHHRVAARGAGGHIMVLFPELDVIVVHRADTDRGRGVSDRDGVKLLDRILAARKGEPPKDCAIGPVRVERLGGNPTPLRDDLTAVPAELRRELEGRFMLSEGTGFRLYQFEERLFVQPLGMRVTNDLEVFAASDGSLRSPIVNLVLKPMRGADESVDAVRVTMRGRTDTVRRARR